MKTGIVIMLVLFVVGSISHADEKMPATPKFSDAFNKMKSLKGTWKGTIGSGKEAKDMTVKYDVTSAGSSVVETHFPGQPHEMVSVYNDVDGKVQMTHYCALQNQPTLKLKSSKGDTLYFDFVNGTNMNPKKDKHMHSLNLKFIGKNKIVQAWTEYENGKAGKTNEITLSRVE